MADAAESHRQAVKAVAASGGYQPKVLCRDATALGPRDVMAGATTPALILTSPPYPGVYVNYHRWKIMGRKETGAPYWIADCPDGHGLAHYTMGARADHTGDRYFRTILEAWSSIGGLVQSGAVVVQVIGFATPHEQLRRYLATMDAAGFTEELLPQISNAPDGRLWRGIPGRRWWVVSDGRAQSAPSTGREAVLVHRKR